MALTCLRRRPALLPLNGVAHIFGHFVKTEERILLVHCSERKTELHFIFVACAGQHASIPVKTTLASESVLKTSLIVNCQPQEGHKELSSTL